MTLIEIRKTVTSVEETRHEGGPVPSEPLVIGTIVAALKNPFAGRHEPDLLPFMAELKELGRDLAGKLVAALATAPRGSRPTARVPSSVGPASSSMAPCGMSPAAGACARSSAAPRQSSLRAR